MNNTAFKTLKTYSGLNTEITDGGFSLPDQILMALEEVQTIEEKPEMLAEFPELHHTLLDRAAKSIMQRHFGKWLPKGADRILQEAFDGLDTVEDKIASLVWASERLKGLEQWKAEQGVIRRAQRHGMKTNTRKVEGKWCEAEVYELPPLVKSEGNGMQHEPARYVFRANGLNVDLGKHDGSWSPVLRSSPDAAMQSVAKRLGKDIRGGAHTILQELTGLTDIIPAYTTIWFQDCWLVIVGWQKDPKLTPSKFWLSEDGKLTMSNIPEQLPLTISELDYHILKDTSDLEIQDEDQVVIDYEDPEEASYNLGIERDIQTDAINTDIFAVDDEELELINFLKENVNRSESFITMGDLQSREAKQALKETLATAKCDALLAKLHFKATKEDKDLELYKKALGKVRIHERMISTYKMIMDDQGSNSIVHHWYRKDSPFVNYSQERVKVIPNAHIAPSGGIETRPMLFSDTKPKGQHGAVMRYKQGTTGVTMKDGKIVTKTIPRLPERPTTARNASPALKRTLAKMINEKFNYSPERNAQREFYRTLDMSLA